MLNSSLLMSAAMTSEFLLIREVEARLYSLRSTKHGIDFNISLETERGFQVYRSGNRQVNVLVTDNGKYAIDYLVDGAFHPNDGSYATQTHQFGEAHLLAAEIVEFFHELHRSKNPGVQNVG